MPHAFPFLLYLVACTPGPGADSAPPDTEDTTDTASADTEDTGGEEPCDGQVDSALLDEADAWIDTHAPYIDSFQLAHCGDTLVEEYRNGYQAGTHHDLQSATKTFSAVLIGIALDQGLIEGVEQPLAELLPDYARLLEGDKAQITLEHLLTMTSGLAWTDFGVGNSFDKIEAAEDSVAFILGEPLETTPGEVFHYNTGSSHLLSAIIHHGSGTTTAAYAEERLFTPLGIETHDWDTLRDGTHKGGWGLDLAPGDFAKLGQLLLDEGSWDGDRIVSQDYVDAATAPQVETDMGGFYGYQAWIETNLFDADDIAGARGYGGQDCLVLEELDMVATFTGDIRYPADNAQDVVTVMNEYVIPAWTGGSTRSAP